jgi:hypothetical protein
MPNWVSTSLNITGPTDEVLRLVSSIKKDEDDKTYRIIESLFPTPSDLRIDATFAHPTTPELWGEWLADGTWTQERYDEQVEYNNTLRTKQEENIAKYGTKDWYDWQYDNWGTKWGDCRTDMTAEPIAIAGGLMTVSFGYDTAWGAPDKAFHKISKDFPNCVFVFEYDEEAGFFMGAEAMRNGETIIEGLWAPCEDQEEMDLDWDSEDAWFEFSEWKDKKNTEVVSKVHEFVDSIIEEMKVK